MTDETLALAVVEAGAPTPFAEAAAMADILEAQHWSMADQGVNLLSGGGAVAAFRTRDRLDADHRRGGFSRRGSRHLRSVPRSIPPGRSARPRL